MMFLNAVRGFPKIHILGSLKKFHEKLEEENNSEFFGTDSLGVCRARTTSDLEPTGGASNNHLALWA